MGGNLTSGISNVGSCGYYNPGPTNLRDTSFDELIQTIPTQGTDTVSFKGTTQAQQDGEAKPAVVEAKEGMGILGKLTVLAGVAIATVATIAAVKTGKVKGLKGLFSKEGAQAFAGNCKFWKWGKEVAKAGEAATEEAVTVAKTGKAVKKAAVEAQAAAKQAERLEKQAFYNSPEFTKAYDKKLAKNGLSVAENTSHAAKQAFYNSPEFIKTYDKHLAQNGLNIAEETAAKQAEHQTKQAFYNSKKFKKAYDKFAVNHGLIEDPAVTAAKAYVNRMGEIFS